MALEIQEIGIRLEVDSNDGAAVPRPGGPAVVQAAGSAWQKPTEAECCGPSEADREALVRDCVRRVLQALDAAGQR